MLRRPPSKLLGSKPLARLLRDTAGNTLAIMAAAMFPLAGLVGGGVDMSRLYLAKARLQQACDAGALAGRKVMGASAWAADGGAANTAALQFFDGNYATGAYGTTGLTRAFAETAGKVTGSASVIVPMTLMRIFGVQSQSLSVVCDAEMRLPNTDVMFVLDNTGSMGNKAVSTDTDTKIVVLKRAVKCFYEAVARLDTDAVCGSGSGPSGGTGSNIQVRFGFVPYATNVNVGRLLPSNFFANNWTYQSRLISRVWGLNANTPTDTTPGAWSGYNVTAGPIYGQTATQCAARRPSNYNYREPTGPMGLAYAEAATNWKADQAFREVLYEAGIVNGACYVAYRTRPFTRTHVFNRSTQSASGAVEFPAWLYKPVQFDISGLKNGTGWNAGITLPIEDSYTSRTVNWNGCIEERQTVRATSYSPIPSGAYDLDIDSAPTPGATASMWGPALFDAIYARRATFDNASAHNTNEITTFTNFSGGPVNECPTQARKLASWPDAGPFSTYVDSLATGGNTYHDIGLLWGARLMSPTGIFSSENRFTPSGGEIERHLIFMTDGETCTSRFNYAAYGLAFYDRRQTPVADVPTDGCSNSSTTGGNLTEQVDARFAALCTAVKNKNVTLWVVYFGTSDTSTTNRMRNCATSGKFFPAADQETLMTTFRLIADQISQLRLTQ